MLRSPFARRLAGVLPAGTLPAGAGVAVLALASYAHLALAGHRLPEPEMANLSVLWAVVFTLGLGLFFPVEQEVTRVSAGRRARGAATAPVWRRGNAIAGALFAGVAVLLLAGSPVLATRLYAGELTLVLVTVGGLFGLAFTAPVRGIAAGAGRFDRYGGQLALDGLLRVVLAALLAVVGIGTAAAFGAVLTAAPVLATLAVLPALRRDRGPSQPLAAGELGPGLAPLVGSALLGQFALNSAVVSVRLLAPEQTALAAALLAALVLVRVPLFIFAALQASLLAGLARAAAAADRAQVGRLLRHACAVVTGLVLVVGVPLVAAGPWLARLLFNAPAGVLGRADFALLVAGTWAYLVALVLGQGAMALRRHRVQLAAWLIGCAVLVVVTLGPGGLPERAEIAYAAGNAVVAATLATPFLPRRLPRARTPKIPTIMNLGRPNRADHDPRFMIGGKSGRGG